MSIVLGIIKESYYLLNEMSPYLLFGFLFAGILHVFIDTAFIARHLGKGSFLSVVKASLFGIPLPLCSCGVIPAAMSLRKEGASKGAILSFLISTPTSGVDSILATYALLGPFFAVYRVIASFVTGVFSGTLANIFLKENDSGPAVEEKKKCPICQEDEEHGHTLFYKVREVFRYAFGALLGDIGKWLIVGIIIGGAISYFMPEKFIETYLGSGLKSMIVMLIVGIPMYVCATGSIPIAAALMLKGMNPGAAFVFLLAGPATNAVGMTVISQQLGKKALAVYLVSISVCSVGMGILMNKIWTIFQSGEMAEAMHHGALIPEPVALSCSGLLVILLLYNVLKKKTKSSESEHHKM